MTEPTPILTPESARRWISERSFCGTTGDRVGVELEWFTTPSDDPPRVSDLERLLAGVRLRDSRLSFEPGAQVELSSAPHPLTDAIACVAADSEVVTQHLARAGIELFATGTDGDRDLALRTDVPRYVAMRKYFDRYGPAGGRMMCGTASIHINLDAGADAEGAERWRAAHALGPTLIAMFANSPFVDGAVSGWKSSRFDAWRVIDPSRTGAVARNGRDPAEAWADYALEARVMFVRDGERFEPLDEPMTMRDWINDGHRLGFPDADDLAYHLTTLFPPVRPRGWIELRMIDMLPSPWWRVAVAVATALVCDPQARAEAVDACRATEGQWDLAARRGAEDATFLASTQTCFALALRSLRRCDLDPETLAAAQDYQERFIATGRCPADEQIERLLTAPTMEAS